MFKHARMCIVAAFVAGLALPGQALDLKSMQLTNANGPTRAFNVDLDGTGHKSLVWFDRSNHQIDVCDVVDSGRCLQIASTAKDLLPIQKSNGVGSDLLLVNSIGASTICSLVTSNGTFTCVATDAPSVLQRVNSIHSGERSTFKLQNSSGTAQCATADFSSIACTGVRQFQSANDTALFGHFSSVSANEFVSLSSGDIKLCEIVGYATSCASIKGLEDIRQAQAIASARIVKGKSSAVVAQIEDDILVCVLNHSKSGNAFSCSRITDTGAKGQIAYIVPNYNSTGLERIEFRNPKSRVANAASAQASFTALNAANVTPSEADAPIALQQSKRFSAGSGGTTSEISYSNQTGGEVVGSIRSPMTVSAQALSTAIMQEANALAATTSGPRPAGTLAGGGPPDQGGDGSDMQFLPEYYEYSDSVDNWDTDFWSDLWDQVYWDWTTGNITRIECMQQCDTDYNARVDSCDMFVGGYVAGGITITLGATLYTAWTGPGAAGVATAGATATLTSAGAISLLCKGVAASRRYSCQIRCPA